MSTDYQTLYIIDDISGFFIFSNIIIVVSVVIAIILYLNLRKRMDKIITILKKKQIDQFNTIHNTKEVNNINFNSEDEDVDENKELNNYPDLSNDQKAVYLFNKFKNWLEKDKLYLDPNIDLNLAAREIGTNRSYLSKSINAQGFGFSEYINKLRITEVIRIFDDENDFRNDYSLPEIASEVGFNARSVFYTSFQKETGMTPSQYKEHLKQFKSERVN